MASVAVVGSGPVGAAIAHYLATRGIAVTVFEKGPATDKFPFVERYVRDQALAYPDAEVIPGLQGLEQIGDYKPKLNRERYFVVGGAGTVWTAQTPRITPADMMTRTRFKYGADWPLTYDELEPSVCDAEAFLGVSGTDADNPFAPPRSKPHPLPPFELGYYERMLADRARSAGIVIHTTPQARARKAYEGRAGCQNFGVCDTCPTGARYAPNFHLQLAVDTGHCTLRTDSSVRRVIIERGRARGVVVRTTGKPTDEEVPASVVVIAGGTFETVRLLMLSNLAHHDHLGRHYILKHSYRGHLHFKAKVFPQRLPFGAQSQQFVDHPNRGHYGGMRLNLSSQDSLHGYVGAEPNERPGPGEMLEAIRLRPNCMRAAMLCESIPDDANFMALGDTKDQFGDPYVRAHLVDTEFDHATYEFATKSLHQLASALDATEVDVAKRERWVSGHHHYGGARMGKTAADSVVDSFGRTHDITDLYVLGGATFPSQSCNNPTLTMVALALRAAKLVAERAA